MAVLMRHHPRRDTVKSAEEIMNMLEAFDLTGSLRDAGELAGCSHHTVAGYVAAREAGVLSARPAPRAGLVDGYVDKVEEWVERSKGKIRADVVHDKLVALGFTGSECTSRRAVAAVKADYRLGRVRVHRPWVTEPGMWLQYDFGDGPLVGGVRTTFVLRDGALPRRGRGRSRHWRTMHAARRRHVRRLVGCTTCPRVAPDRFQLGPVGVEGGAHLVEVVASYALRCTCSSAAAAALSGSPEDSSRTSRSCWATAGSVRSGAT